MNKFYRRHKVERKHFLELMKKYFGINSHEKETKNNEKILKTIEELINYDDFDSRIAVMKKNKLHYDILGTIETLENGILLVLLRFKSILSHARIN